MYFAFFFKVYEILFENHIILSNNYSTKARSVADSDLQLRGGAAGGGGHPDPEKRGGVGLKKKIVRAPSGLSLVYK